MVTVGEGKGGMTWESSPATYITVCEVDSRGNLLCDPGNWKLVLCDDLERVTGREVGGQFRRQLEARM